jgi:pyridoxine 5-phosphate synthase
VAGQVDRLKDVCTRMDEAGVRVSLFIDADKEQIDAAKETGAPVIELHTGHYADLGEVSHWGQQQELMRIREAAAYAHGLGLQVNAGHGLHYHNVQPIARIPEIVELNIGHAIVAHAVFVGFTEAVREMKRLMVQARMMG